MQVIETIIFDTPSGTASDKAGAISFFGTLIPIILAYFVYKFAHRKFSKYKTAKAKVVIGVLVAVFTVISLMTYSIAKSETRNIPYNKNTSKNWIKEYVESMNQTAPRRVDSRTTLQGAEVAGVNEVTHMYRLTGVDSSMLTDQFERTLKAKQRNYFCSRDRLTKFVNMNTKINTVYYDESGEELLRVFFNAGNCKE